jgi:hypothetical protein
VLEIHAGILAAMIKKKVYVNELLIGEAFTWAEVTKLVKASGVIFTEKPGAAEGPTGFYLHGILRGNSARELRKSSGSA